MNAQPKNAKLIVLVEESLKAQIEEEAQRTGKYCVHGEPSKAEVVRTALRYFFSKPFHVREIIAGEMKETA